MLGLSYRPSAYKPMVAVVQSAKVFKRVSASHKIRFCGGAHLLRSRSARGRRALCEVLLRTHKVCTPPRTACRTHHVPSLAVAHCTACLRTRRVVCSSVIPCFAVCFLCLSCPPGLKQSRTRTRTALFFAIMTVAKSVVLVENLAHGVPGHKQFRIESSEVSADVQEGGIVIKALVFSADPYLVSDVLPCKFRVTSALVAGHTSVSQSRLYAHSASAAQCSEEW